MGVAAGRRRRDRRPARREFAVVPRPPARAGALRPRRSPRVVGRTSTSPRREHNLERERPVVARVDHAARRATSASRRCSTRVSLPCAGGRALPAHRGRRAREATRRWPACAAWRSTSGPAASSSSRTAAWTSTACACDPGWPRGVLPAVRGGARRPGRRRIHAAPRAASSCSSVTCHPDGFLQRAAATPRGPRRSAGPRGRRPTGPERTRRRPARAGSATAPCRPSPSPRRRAPGR